MYIDSTANKIVKNTRKLFERSGRKALQQFIIEGRRLVADAIAAGAEVDYVLVEEGVDFTADGVEIHTLSSKAFSSLKTTVNSQGILAVVKMVEDRALSVKDGKRCFYIYLDGVSDPGNMGTIIRTADACGADGVILSKNCVDVYNPKVVRSTMSAIFNVPIYFDDEIRSAVATLKSGGVSVISGSLEGDKSLYDIDFTGRCAIVIGNEANGITDEITSMSDKLIKIPIIGKAESLNAAVACAVISYEALRQNL